MLSLPITLKWPSVIKTTTSLNSVSNPVLPNAKQDFDTKAEIIAPRHVAEKYTDAGWLGCQVVALGVSEALVTYLQLQIER
jgi:hypothetical protein